MVVLRVRHQQRVTNGREKGGEEEERWWSVDGGGRSPRRERRTKSLCNRTDLSHTVTNPLSFLHHHRSADSLLSASFPFGQALKFPFGQALKFSFAHPPTPLSILFYLTTFIADTGSFPWTFAFSHWVLRGSGFLTHPMRSKHLLTPSLLKIGLQYILNFLRLQL